METYEQLYAKCGDWMSCANVAEALGRSPSNIDSHHWPLDAAHPGVELLNATTVGKTLGISRQTAVRRYPFDRGYITKIALARALARSGCR